MAEVEGRNWASFSNGQVAPVAEVERLQTQLADAWDEGWKVGADDQKRWRGTWPGWNGPTPNPYRP